MISRSSSGPGLAFLRFDFGLLGIQNLYHIVSIWSPRRESDPNDRNGHTVANRARLPVPPRGDHE